VAANQAAATATDRAAANWSGARRCPASAPGHAAGLHAREIARVGGTRPIRIELRLIGACNCDLGTEVSAGRFGEDCSLFELG
jgi:hypothetical protein